MKNFIDIVNRLKVELSVSTDKEIADFLGLKKSAFAERKKRNSFPKKELELFTKNFPELNLDLEYILTGVKKDEKNKSTKIHILPIPEDAGTPINLNLDEMRLIENFRKASIENKLLILNIAGIAKSLYIAELKLSEYEKKDFLYK
ncbi:helix-turn-helix domain-containing protein [Phocoenobacter skyensis]|uniref:Helix-turn-helix domain-containing protein n=1 Tax=Phocoenobacter skyensis TaxID=97481 RepID=A0ABT9JN22_9PAST|nr:helix-turn-helix domain-containing protein [Pasteurella skyensis]MDP8079551.1 helix-turn-helix domain-containing protein [Pasteurella skyensis]MDP8085423.1 helix-turn-helix domain-containing protein [Pasteurella skyensis]